MFKFVLPSVEQTHQDLNNYRLIFMRCLDQMYQTGMMIQQQNMMGGQPQFNNGSNSGQMQMMQQTSQPQQMQGKINYKQSGLAFSNASSY